MNIEFNLPSIGEGVTSADVAEILVKPGDEIKSGQVVMELETEKAVVELCCPHAGKIVSIHPKTGDTIMIGAPVLTVDAAKVVEGESTASPKAAGPKKIATGAPPTTVAAAKTAVSTAAPPAKASTAVASKGGIIEFQLPSIGEGVKQADVAEVLVREGDIITADQVVMELETEKAVVELRCPFAGKIQKLLAKSGQTIAVGAPVLLIESTESAGTSATSKRPDVVTTQSRPVEATTTTATTKSTETSAIASPSAAAPATLDSDQPPAPAAPSTRRLARELGVDLRQVQGTGPGGRITHEDVQSYVKSKLTALSVPSASTPARATFAEGSITPPPLPDFTKYGLIERQSMSKIARVTAENLCVSWNVIPHVTHHDRADITDLEGARKRFAAGAGKNGPKVTMTAIVMKALTKCLQAYPKFNSSLDPLTNEIVLKRYYNIGCAVDTENGLFVPIVKGCDSKSIVQIASELNTLAEKARERKLSMDAMQGATCTVTNLGGIGGVAFTPIVNYPEVCILGMCRGQTELRLNEGRVEERLMLPLSLSYDHRVINGADAARFMVSLTQMLADPFQLLAAL